ncbi:MAG: hypothetical protein K2H84_01845 [Paramuribaculum sp.]|nr:hypothetical protein [Paramuribaculum sp.]
MNLTQENNRRKSLLPLPQDPATGHRCIGERRLVTVNGETLYLPVTMLGEATLSSLQTADFQLLRCAHDFEYWAWRCVRIRHKLTGQLVPFVLNNPQRKVLEVLEADRLAGLPLRIILLKARQWGGSTLIQIYMAWIQCVLRDRWNSVICAHVKNTATAIRAMYSNLLESYPPELWSADCKPSFRTYGGSRDTRVIAGRNSTVTIGSSWSQEASRGLDCSMAHLSEVAFWADCREFSPEAFVQAVCSGIPLQPLTLVALESTANGVGNYFHREWLRAKHGQSDKRPVFIPWYEIEIYRSEVADPQALWESMDEYERSLWHRGLTLEMIAWYHSKRREMASDEAMKAEFPTDDVEAFVHSGASVFSPALLDRLRQNCSAPVGVGEITGDAPTGEDALANVRFLPDSLGALEIWEHPIPGREYVAVVDIGGRTRSADFSVIAVLDRTPGLTPSVVAQWRGHIDHDLLAWKAASLAMYFHEALLVIESNTLESELGGASRYILDSLAEIYPRLYYRRSESGSGRKVGFHTNRTTKNLIITALIAAVRENAYIERSSLACDEMATYCQLPTGAYAAREGCHDDILITRAIALYVEPQGTAVHAESPRVLLSRARWR